MIGRVTGAPSTVDASEIGHGCATGGKIEFDTEKEQGGRTGGSTTGHAAQWRVAALPATGNLAGETRGRGGHNAPGTV